MKSNDYPWIPLTKGQQWRGLFHVITSSRRHSFWCNKRCRKTDWAMKNLCSLLIFTPPPSWNIALFVLCLAGKLCFSSINRFSDMCVECLVIANKSATIGNTAVYTLGYNSSKGIWYGLKSTKCLYSNVYDKLKRLFAAEQFNYWQCR